MRHFFFRNKEPIPTDVFLLLIFRDVAVDRYRCTCRPTARHCAPVAVHGRGNDDITASNMCLYARKTLKMQMRLSATRDGATERDRRRRESKKK